VTGIGAIPRNSLGSTVKLGGKTHTLTRKRTVLGVRPGAEVTLFDGAARIRSQAGGRLHFPCLPFNPYSKGNRSALRHAFLRFEVPLAPGQACLAGRRAGGRVARARIRLTVRPGTGR
jgi:hypothetical protein